MNTIEKGTILSGDLVELRPLDESHFDELDMLAENKRIWEFCPVDMSDSTKRRRVFSQALVEQERGTQFPFVIFHKKDNRLIGSTRLMDIQAQHNRLEIGWTWLHPDYWATPVNPECKLLLMTFCFEQLNASRLQLKTDEHNMRSRKAIGKIGGQYEGILRHDMLRENGTYRDSAYFSILDSEWQHVKTKVLPQYRSNSQGAVQAINFNNKRFLLTGNSDNGKVNTETIFDYRQDSNVVTADYYGGTIKTGKIIANFSGDKLDMLYQCMTTDNELKAGKAIADVSLDEKGRIKLRLNWEWLGDKKETGTSEYIEVDR
ncbi:MAG: N-acetyltransferase [Flavipsychrobacter sp.]|nr:N-acetyltransferase [Flavipsychrobacter sp.]